VVTITAQDLTTAAGLGALTNGLKPGSRVKISAVPLADRTLKADVVTSFGGDQPIR
jgi:hypothetical protein